ncbi:hypothetical protein NEOLI_001486 [Neolecta irregularis DAH-3]|uniref:Uncharacterized protein n=1 Tax=Neolecta irregularis (strain DAH-3) TaxID=1198029 RepID=A0A1U7LQR2_NEOID|nr:hypothetical protein NEOLI_001486 [Neolecta irregularis DAH-3]|eukprot:OLL24892.1 hypothetical protein NEOLI_001486 [Neolecta irregularis DAH-3]
MIKEMVEILIARAELADPHGEGATLRKHQKKQDDDVTKDKQDLFPGIFAEIPSHRIRDDEDNVWRCSSVKTEGRECGHCGLVFSDAFDEESFSNGDSEQAEDEDESEGSLAGFIEHDEYDHHTRHWFHIDAIDEDGTDYSSDIHADEMDPELLAFIDHRNTSEVEGGDHTFDEIREGLSETEGYGGPYDDSMMEELRREQFGHAYSDEDGQNQEPSHIFISSDQEDELDCDDPPQQGQPSLVSSTHTTPHIVPRTIRRRPVINTTDEEDGDEEQSESRGLSCNDLEVADSEASEINSDSGPLRGRGPNYFSSRDLREDDSNSEDVHATVQVINPRRRKRARTERPAAVTITIDSDEEY